MAARAAIDELNIYPLKSARGIPRSQARLTATGRDSGERGGLA